MLKEFLRQTEDNDMAPIKEGNRHPFPERMPGVRSPIVAALIREIIDRPHKMASRTNIQSGVDGTAQKFWDTKNRRLIKK